MTILIIISSKSPNDMLYKCIELLYKIQIKEQLNYKICVVDSDSSNFTNYTYINKNFPHVEILYSKNKNYEYGAWKYALELYPYYEMYFCIHDTMLIEKEIDLSAVNNDCVYTWHHNSGYNSHPSIKKKGIEYLKKSGLNYESIIDLNFTLAYGCVFIVSNKIMKDIFNTLTIRPIDKDGSCIYERNFGLYFIIKQINTINLDGYLIKYHGNRI
jgi:hypothetical protein